MDSFQLFEEKDSEKKKSKGGKKHGEDSEPGQDFANDPADCGKACLNARVKRCLSFVATWALVYI